jgi:hypothetical protein
MVTFSLGGRAVSIQIPSNFVYERRASTLAVPVPASAVGYKLIDWTNPYYPTKQLILEAIGTDQHDNSIYTWVIDGVVLESSGAARVGSVTEPFKFGSEIRVTNSIALLIDNNNGVGYPNAGINPIDATPYEGVFIGRWGT